MNIIYRIYRDVNLLIKSPKDYLYTFKHSRNQTIKVYPYNPKIKELAKITMARINAVFPELEIRLLGSLGLEIPGKGDIDLFIECDSDDFDKYLATFIKMFGELSKRRKDYIEWDVKINGIDAEIVLIDPNSGRLKNQIRMFNLLKRNKELLNQYVEMKKRINNLSEREYIKERMVFFNSLNRLA